MKSVGDKARNAWRRLRASAREEAPPPANGTKWAPHLYVNSSDYLCYQYCSEEGSDGCVAAGRQSSAGKVFVAAAKTPQKFVEAHGLQQWWSEDVELHHGHRGKLIQ